MALSLNRIVSILSDRVGQPFNVNLQKELKDIIIYKRADYTRQFLDANPYQRQQFIQSFKVEVEEIESLECDIDLECHWFRSKCEIAQPIRSKSVIWDYVGSPDYAVGFGYMPPEFMRFHTASKYTSLNPKWFWQDNKLIIMNEESIKFVGVRGIPADPRTLVDCACVDDAQSCFDDDSDFPITEDILNAIIRDTLNVELRNIFPEPAVVQVDKKEDAVVANQE
jgi:hypothetical protein